MIYRVYSTDANNLLSRPESGMGYQIIEARKYNRLEFKKFVVYNSELALDLDNDFSFNKRQIEIKGYQQSLSSSDVLMLDTSSIRVLKRESPGSFTSLTETKATSKKRHRGGRGATENPIEYSNGNEIFVRLSAYENDRRIDTVNRKLRAGSYTTTHEDYLTCVATGDDPVDRYALPNNEEIKWAFFSKPLSTDPLQRGIVQPAFGHDGGGIEAYFANGTSNNTYFAKRDYGR